MRVSTRLFLAVVPSVVSVLSVAALAYWGQYGRHAPELLVLVAAVASVLSLVIAWRNTRHVAQRIEHLLGAAHSARGPAGPVTAVRDAARPGRAGTPPDELDSIASVVDRLSGAVTSAEDGRRRQEAEAGRRVQEYAALLAETTAAVTRQLQEVRLPLHILLDNHFGALNPNQEEMLAAAQSAADAADLELRRLHELADIDRGALRPRRDAIRANDLVDSVLPTLAAFAKRTGVRLATDIPPGLPRIRGDRARLQEALELLLRHHIRHTETGRPVALAVAVDDAGGIRIDITHDPAPGAGADLALAERVVMAHGGTVTATPRHTSVRLPGAGAGAVARTEDR